MSSKVRIYGESMSVVKGSSSIAEIASKMGEPWKSGIKERIKKTVKLVESGVFKSEWDDKTSCVCLVTELAGGYIMLTIFLESD